MILPFLKDLYWCHMCGRTIRQMLARWQHGAMWSSQLYNWLGFRTVMFNPGCTFWCGLGWPMFQCRIGIAVICEFRETPRGVDCCEFNGVFYSVLIVLIVTPALGDLTFAVFITCSAHLVCYVTVFNLCVGRETYYVPFFHFITKSHFSIL